MFSLPDHLSIKISQELVSLFAHAVGDFSSIHSDHEYARSTRFRRIIIHGMLPVSLLYFLMINRALPQDNFLYLKSIKCRFLNPLFIDDVIELKKFKLDSLDELAFRFEIKRKNDGMIATNGEMIFSISKSLQNIPKNNRSLFEIPLIEEALTSKDLLPGKKDSVVFAPTAGFIQPFLRAASEKDVQFLVAESDSNFIAIMASSPLIGMRLPGRYATFLELNSKFVNLIQPNEEVKLSGEIYSELSLTNRIKVGLSWEQGNEKIGLGQAISLVNEPVKKMQYDSSSIDSNIFEHLTGKVALITGASRGIGEATARLFAQQGLKVVVHYFQGKSDALKIVEDIKKMGKQSIAIQADLRNEDEVAKMFYEINSTFGGVDILVNNAVGQFSPKDFFSTTKIDFLSEFNISLFGMNECCKLAIPNMKLKRWGKIVNVGSIITEIPVSGQIVYTTMKSALIGYTRSLASEFSSYNIHANIVLPQMTETSLITGIPKPLIAKSLEDSIQDQLLQPIDVAKVILLFASDLTNSIVGQRIALNRGMPPYL